MDTSLCRKYPIPVIGAAFTLAYLAIYTIHDFTFQIFAFLNKDNPFENSFCLQMLNAFKVFGTFVSVLLAESKHNHRKLISLSFLLYGVTAICLYIADLYKESDTKLACLIFIVSLYYFSLGGVFGLIDGYTTNILVRYNLMRHYSFIRIFASLGHMIAYIPAIILDIFEDKEGNFQSLRLIKVYDSTVKFHIKLVSGCLYGFIAAIYFYSMLPDFKGEKTAKAQNSASKTLSNTYSVIISPFGFVLLSILTAGFSRACFNTFQRLFYRKIDFSESKGNVIHICRLIFEIIVYNIIGLRASGSPYGVFLLALAFSMFRSVLITIIDKDMVQNHRAWVHSLAQISEFSKAAFSACYGYSTVEIARELSTPDTRTTAQGLVTVLYTGTSNILFSIFGLITMGKKHVDNSAVDDYVNVFHQMSIVGILGFVFFLMAVLTRKMKLKQGLQ